MTDNTEKYKRLFLQAEKRTQYFLLRFGFKKPVAPVWGDAIAAHTLNGRHGLHANFHLVHAMGICLRGDGQETRASICWLLSNALMR